MRTRLIFVRHAEAEGNFKRIFHGWTDSEITEKGHLQAKRVAEKLKDVKIDVLYSSSLKRTMQTAKYISEVKGLPIIKTDKLKEINGGDWEGQDWDVLPKKWPVEYDTWENRPHVHKMPNGESMEEFQQRVVNEVKSIIEKNEGKNICIVTHGTVIRALQCYFHACELDWIINIPWQDNTAVTIVDYEDGKFNFIVEGDTSHLENGLGTIEGQEWWIEYKNNLEKIRERTKNAGNRNQRGKLVQWLFETKAIRVCPPDRPFWYTSGTIGPYYINTHFLYGSEEKAKDLLEVIDREKKNTAECPRIILEKALANYEEDPLYRGVIDELCAFIKEKVALDEVDLISGGERRDWFFSLTAAHILEKPHLTIYKDLKAVIAEKDRVTEADDLDGRRVLHIADLVTEASSYERAWIPAVKNRNGRLKWSFSIVDRNQGGASYLKSQGIEFFPMIKIDEGFFDEALKLGIINAQQHEMVLDYLKNPWESMRNFLIKHPEFLENALKADEKTRERAQICIEKNIYGL